MFTFETSDQKEVRRLRIAQFNGRTAIFRSARFGRHRTRPIDRGKQVKRPGGLGDHHHSRSAQGQHRNAGPRPAFARLRKTSADRRTAARAGAGIILVSGERQRDQAGCSSALRTRSAVLRAPSLRMASAR